ncbi:BZ3500_MvSof-1268-A1-R1_Chr4-3g07362 [Microbotryum saponariae]|uniref:Thioredoxin n=1 Tax=Microbotryum saponariae TaxID=289078 RepID=A0A2X0MCR7_9BASI|nr:BZ3500_MvSof-1268-A1-R1_Chr4-3g07362 [Microbotryum saponariae]SDA07025.1 BZ3501_MvSof-1269-A2-R1_Chr4-2g07071 [Microbotryum saponariae]
MSLITHLSSLAEHDRLIAAKKDKLVVIDFHATWCGPCHAIAPKFDQLSKIYRDATFCKVDVDAAKDIAQKYSIRAMPTFVLTKNGSKLNEIRGANAAGLEAAIRKHSSSSAGGGPVFPGSGHTLSGAPAAGAGAGGEGTPGSGFLKVIVVVGLIWLWVSYARKAEAVDAQVLGL